MQMFRFLEWSVYKESKKLFKIVYNFVDKLPDKVRFDLGRHMLRAAFSVILNIAEGSGKSSDKELNRYFDISIGSLNETVAAADVLKDNNLISDEVFDLVKEKAESISKQLGGFKKTLL
ncbi:MAG: four helix bundle protein [Planctomycetota bacterium]